MTSRKQGIPAKKARKTPAPKKGVKKAKAKKQVPARAKPSARSPAKPKPLIGKGRVVSQNDGPVLDLGRYAGTYGGYRPDPPPRRWARFRSAITVLFVSLGFAKKHPDTTVRERVDYDGLV